eukprot:c16835_g1_i1 orf=312-1625(-)
MLGAITAAYIMPALSFTSLDRLIEPASSSPSKEAASSTDRSTPFSFYPPLYATPPQQRPPSPSSFSPSPYVLNFKRRGPAQQQQNGGKASTVEASADSTLQQQQQQRVDTLQCEDTADVPVEQNTFANVAKVSANGNGASRKAGDVIAEYEVFEMELDRRDALNNAFAHRNKGPFKKDTQFCKNSSANIDPGIGRELPPVRASLGSSLAINEEPEFFDAPDSVFSDSASEDEVCPSSTQSGKCPGGCGGRTARRLEEEIARRIKAEETVALWQKRWNEMAKRCSSNGISICSQAGEVLEKDGNSFEGFTQELLVARLVGGAIASAVVRAEKDGELENMLAIKNREISRLWDKLQYLELVNREMSQRNQEVTELAQRRRKRRQRRQKLALGGFCAAFCIGTAGLVFYKFAPWDQAKGWANLCKKSLEGELSSAEVCKE